MDDCHQQRKLPRHNAHAITLMLSSMVTAYWDHGHSLLGPVVQVYTVSRGTKYNTKCNIDDARRENDDARGEKNKVGSHVDHPWANIYVSVHLHFNK